MRTGMTEGSLADKIILFALPLALSGLLQQLFNTADTAVVGRFASPQAMAAVGSNTQVVNLLLNLFIGMSVGANVLLAHKIGAGERRELPRIVGNVIAVALCSGILLLVFGQLVIAPLLSLLNLPEEILPKAILYMRILFFGMPLFMLYNFGAAVLRSKGDSKRPFYAMAIAGVLNVALNLVFVIVLKLDVAGVALATVLSAGFSSSMMLVSLLREEEDFRLRRENIRIDRAYLMRMLQIGVPAGLQASMFSISNVIIQAGINSLGSDVIAGNTAGVTSQAVMYFMINAFTQTTVTFTGQNYGAAKADRCRRVFRLCMLFSVGLTLAMVAFFLVLRYPFVRIFTTDENVMHFAIVQIMRTVPLYFLVCTYEISSGAMRGMGYSLFPAIVSFAGTCVLRIVWVYTVFARFHTYETLLLIYPITWIVTGSVMVASYFAVQRRAFRRIGTT